MAADEDEKHVFKEENYELPSVATDVVLFTIADNELQVLLVKRRTSPFEGEWAIPGGFVEIDESLEDAARRELLEETGVTEDYLEQLYTWGEPDRDPRKRVISVSYFALIAPGRAAATELSSQGDIATAEWFPAYDPPSLAFDHDKILETALQRLRAKLEYTTVAFALLPDTFTLTELQNVYETVFNKSFDKRNFRRKVKDLGLVEATGERRTNVSHRPPELYRFNDALEIGEIVEIL